MSTPIGDEQPPLPSAVGRPGMRLLDGGTRSLFRELDRVVGDLRRGGGVVQRPDRHPAAVADAAHRLAQLLADAAADARGEPRRTVPRIADYAVADQIEVVSRELRDAVDDTGAVDIGTLRRPVDAMRELMLRGVPR